LQRQRPVIEFLRPITPDGRGDLSARVTGQRLDDHLGIVSCQTSKVSDLAREHDAAVTPDGFGDDEGIDGSAALGGGEQSTCGARSIFGRGGDVADGVEDTVDRRVSGSISAHRLGDNDRRHDHLRARLPRGGEGRSSPGIVPPQGEHGTRVKDQAGRRRL
jgi:hypothetical protein